MSAIRADQFKAAAENLDDTGRSLLDRNDEAWFLLDGETRILDLSPDAARLLGGKKNEFLGRPISDSALSPENGSWAQIALALGDGTSAHFRARYAANGHTRCVPVALHRALYGGGMLLVARDGNENRERSTEDLLGIVRMLPDVLFRCVKREDGKIYWTLNEGRLAEEFHLTTKEIEGKSLEELFPGGASAHIRDEFERAFEGDAHVWTNQIGDRWFKHYPQPVFGADGKVESVIGFITEVTELVRAEEHIRRLNTQLEDRVRELEAANRDLETFGYSVSHDLRNPLAVIDSMAQLLARSNDRLDADDQKRLTKMQTSIGRMGEMIEELLTLSRTTRKPVERKETDLSRVAQEIAADLTLRSGESRPDWLIAPDLAAACDPTLARTLLENLLGNAWKYSAKAKHPTISFGIESTDQGLAFCVRDNGVGFDMQDAADMFRPFRRLGTSAGYEGSGVGLAIVERVVRRHGGRIWAHSEPGQGASFWFTLGPQGARTTDAAPASAAEEEKADDPAPEASATKDIRVLLVDDNTDILESTADVLDVMGYTPRATHKADVALEIFRKEPADVVLRDVNMPGSDLMAWMQHLRALPNGDKTIVLLFTASTNDLQIADKVGADGVVWKPFKVEDLEKAISDGLAQR